MKQAQILFAIMFGTLAIFAALAPLNINWLGAPNFMHRASDFCPACDQFQRSLNPNADFTNVIASAIGDTHISKSAMAPNDIAVLSLRADGIFTVRKYSSSKHKEL